MKITNTQPGPRGVNTIAGQMLVEPNQTIEAKVYARESEHIAATGWFTVEGEFEPNPGEQVRAPMNDDSSVKAALVAKDAEIDALKLDVVASNAAIVSLKRDLAAKDDEIAKLKAELEAAAANDEPSSERDELKKQAVELGITFARNITTDKLRALIDAKLAA